MNENEIVNLIHHFDETSLDQPIAWYANIDLNTELSSAWRKIVTTPVHFIFGEVDACLLYTSPSPRDGLLSRMPSSA